MEWLREWDIIGTIAGQLRDTAQWLATDGVALLVSGVESVTGAIINAFENLNLLEKVQTAVGDVETWLTEDAPEALVGTAESLADDMASAFEGFAEGIGEGMRSAINAALNLPFEHTIGAVEVQGEEVFGGETITVPALAEGGVVEDETLAMVGEGQESEAVAPLSKLERMIDMGGGGSQEVVVQFEGEGALVDLVRQEATVVVRDEERRRAGQYQASTGGSS